VKKRICIVINSLVQGGAQKSAILLATELKNLGHDVQILTFYPEQTDFFKVPKDIQIERFVYPFQDNGRVNGRNRFIVRFLRISNRLKDFRNLRKTFVKFKPDLVISFEAATSVMTFFANFGLSPQVISERVHPQHHLIPKWASVLRPIVYRSRNTILHCQGNTIAEWMIEEYQKNIFVIPNFLGEETTKIWNTDSKKVKIFSRYAEQKGIDLGIKAWSLLPRNLRDQYKLEIFGDGDLSKFADLVLELNLNSDIQLNGPTKDMQQELADCLLYIMPSRFEGFPNALAESMGYGIPSLVTDCPSAVRDLTINGKLARLSQLSPEEIAKNIEYLLLHPDELAILSSSGRDIRRYFDDVNTLSEWTDLIMWILDGNVVPEIECKACRSKVNKTVAVRTRAGLRRELNSIWDIQVEMYDMGSKPVVSAGRCHKCSSMNFNGSQGNKKFYDSCYKSSLYSRNHPWEYKIQLETILNSEKVLNVLDFGGGISPFAIKKSSKFDLTVVDLSPAVHQELKLLNIQTYFDLSEIPDGIKFDHINISHTIEHVDNPIYLLLDLVKLLNPSGKIYVTTPDSNHPYLLSSPLAWPPHHTITFSPNAILEILKNTGLKNCQIFRNPNPIDSAFDFMVSGEM
jgi:GalNAc-alpha-(1->4)-GalNAc-alpha-(1->3)-diNAcBac-PP-undecaprenol alpha-1,4-N-acetyl-D-galactosaminyltransferase